MSGYYDRSKVTRALAVASARGEAAPGWRGLAVDTAGLASSGGIDGSALRRPARRKLGSLARGGVATRSGAVAAGGVGGAGSESASAALADGAGATAGGTLVSGAVTGLGVLIGVEAACGSTALTVRVGWFDR